MLTFIPSRSRAAKVKGYTLRYFAQDDPTVFLVVPEDQLDRYRLHGVRHQTLGCPVDGISLTRQWMAQECKKRGHSHILMLDDDLKFFTRGPDLKLTKVPYHGPTTPNPLAPALAEVEAEFKKGHTAVGISVRQGNNQWTDDRKYNTRLLRAFGFDVDAFLACEHGRVPVMEDFDVMLQMLRKGQPNVGLFNWSQDQNGTQTAGGCSDYRTHALHEAAAHELARLHHPFVKTREKKNKTGGEFGTRTEVTIFWKKAFASAEAA